MKTKNNFLILILLIAMQLSTQTWEVYVGVSDHEEYGFDVIETYDKGYLFVVPTENGESLIVNKLSINGDILWEKTYYHNSFFLINKIIETSDMGYVMVGTSHATPTGMGVPLIIKFNSCFEKEWCRLLYKENAISSGNAWDVIENEEGILIVLNKGNCVNPKDRISLIGMTMQGDFLWEKYYATQEDYPNMIYHSSGYDLQQFNGEYYISGFAYYSPEGSPNSAYIRPVIIGVDADYNEKWLLPFGIDNDVVGELTYNYHFSGDTIWGSGAFRFDGGNKSKPLIVATNSNGEELGYYIVEDDSIQAGYTSVHEKLEISKLENGRFIACSSFGEDNYSVDNGEIIFDTLGNVYKYVSHPNVGMPRNMEATMDGKYLESATYYYPNNSTDAYLYKFNQDLEPDTLYTQSFEYDYLCPETIESEDITLDGCITVGVEDLPTPKEYYSYIATIPIRIYPNPASNIVYFELENTEHHKNILLQVYDLQSRPVFQAPIAKGQTTAETDVSHWASGMYAVLVFSNGKVVGREKFVVR